MESRGCCMIMNCHGDWAQNLRTVACHCLKVRKRSITKLVDCCYSYDSVWLNLFETVVPFPAPILSKLVQLTCLPPGRLVRFPLARFVFVVPDPVRHAESTADAPLPPTKWRRDWRRDYQSWPQPCGRAHFHHHHHHRRVVP